MAAEVMGCSGVVVFVLLAVGAARTWWSWREACSVQVVAGGGVLCLQLGVSQWVVTFGRFGVEGGLGLQLADGGSSWFQACSRCRRVPCRVRRYSRCSLRCTGRSASFNKRTSPSVRGGPLMKINVVRKYIIT